MPAQAGARLTLGGKQHTLRITWRALETLESEYELGLEALGVQFQDPKNKLRAVKIVVWLGMLHANPGLTVDELTDMLDDCDPIEVMEAAAALLQQRFASVAEGNGSRPPAKGGRKRRSKAGQ